MKATTVALLARPSDAGERRRFLLIAVATMVAGGLLVAAARIARIRTDYDGVVNVDGYVASSLTRTGTVFATVLLAGPLLALAVQALRVGSLARDRRMASLRLAGATPAEVRTIAAAEAGGAALVGGVLAGPAYLLLTLLLGTMLPMGWRLVPPPEPIDVAFWAFVVVMSGLCGALAGALVQRQAVVEPLGVRRRSAERSSPRYLLVGLIGGPLLVVATTADAVQLFGFWLAIPLVGGTLMFASALAPLVARFAGGTLARRGSTEHLLAGRRIAADPSSSRRAIGVLLVCGYVLGILGVGVADDVHGHGYFRETPVPDYMNWYPVTGAAVLVAVLVAVLTLVVGYWDQLLDARRPLASLWALGVDEPALGRVLRLQMSAASVPSVVLGVVAGGFEAGLLGNVGSGRDELPLSVAVIAVVVVALVAGLAVSAAARLAARLLRSRLREVIDPENLRVA